MKHLPPAKYSDRHRSFYSEQNKNSCPRGAYVLMKAQTTNRKKKTVNYVVCQKVLSAKRKTKRRKEQGMAFGAGLTE